MPNPIKATPLVTGDSLPNALQPTNVAIAELIESVRRLEPAIRGTGEAANDATKELASSTLSLNQFASGLARSGVVLGFATSQFSSFTSAVQSGIASAVGAFDPSAVKRWELTVRDLHAVFGDIFRPVLERANVVVRALADGIESLSPSTKTMVAAIAVAGVSMATMTALTAAFSAAVATATGGLSLAIGAVVGAIAGVGAGVGTMALTMEEFKGTIRELAAAGSAVMDVLGKMAADLVKQMQPSIRAAAEMTVELARFAATAVQVASDLEFLTQGVMSFGEAISLYAEAVHRMAGVMRTLTDSVRELLGMPALAVGGSEGKAVANVRMGDPQGLRNELLKNAFSMGGATNYPQQTVGHLVDVKKFLEEIRNLLKAPLAIKAIGGAESFAGGSRSAAKFAVENGGAGAVDRMRQMFD